MVHLVGEQNPYSRDPDDALLPYPDGSAGHRFCTRILRMPRAVYLRRFRRLNLCQGERWSAKQACAAARALIVGLPFAGDDALILLGSKVALAFVGALADASDGTAPPLDLAPFQRQNFGAFVVVTLPHPSGRSRAWNEPDAAARARALVEAEVGPWDRT